MAETSQYLQLHFTLLCKKRCAVGTAGLDCSTFRPLGLTTSYQGVKTSRESQGEAAVGQSLGRVKEEMSN